MKVFARTLRARPQSHICPSSTYVPALSRVGCVLSHMGHVLSHGLCAFTYELCAITYGSRVITYGLSH
jgi:hypothetical protein